MRAVHAYLSRRAQSIWPDALVTHEDDDTDWRIERAGQDPVILGEDFGRAKQALLVMLAAARAAQR